MVNTILGNIDKDLIIGNMVLDQLYDLAFQDEKDPTKTYSLSVKLEKVDSKRNAKTDRYLVKAFKEIAETGTCSWIRGLVYPPDVTTKEGLSQVIEIIEKT